jgi:hypothetical protein
MGFCWLGEMRLHEHMFVALAFGAVVGVYWHFRGRVM